MNVNSSNELFDENKVTYMAVASFTGVTGGMKTERAHTHTKILCPLNMSQHDNCFLSNSSAEIFINTF